MSTLSERRVNAALREQARNAMYLQNLAAQRKLLTPASLRCAYRGAIRVVAMLEEALVDVRRK